MSTFHGLEMAKQALFAQQSALYTTGHNISNANTDGYSRQRVNFETMPAYPVPGMNRSGTPGQMGTGVEIGSVQRIRDQFLDIQYRAENSRSGYWTARSEALSRMEELLNEPSDSGLSKTMDQFWQSLQDLAVNPENSGARSVVAQRGLAVAETFNHLSKTLHSIQDDLKSQIEEGDVKTANSLLHQIHNINTQIRKIEPHGMLANDLYDDRDRLIDELSKIMNIKVTRDDSSESAPDNAGGVLSIELVDAEGHSIEVGDTEKIVLLDGHGDYEDEYFDGLISVGINGAVNSISIKDGEQNAEGNSNEMIENLTLDTFLQSTGSLAGLIEAHGYGTDGTEGPQGEYPKMIEQLDEMAKVFAESFNEIHENGYNLSDREDEQGNKMNTDQSFFTSIGDSDSITAGSITVLKDILDDPNLIAAAVAEPSEGQDGEGDEEGSDEDNKAVAGNGANAQALANIFSSIPHDSEGNPLLDGKTINGYYESLIGGLGVQAQKANRMTNNTEVLLSQVDHQRMSISAVSLDEEMSNMIKFQHAYNAAARNMTAIDEMIDRIINNMGLVGR